jgi:hypothetical protein
MYIYFYIYTWKYQKETPCVAILNKQECLFSFFYKIREQEGGTGPGKGENAIRGRWMVPLREGRRWGKAMGG